MTIKGKTAAVLLLGSMWLITDAQDVFAQKKIEWIYSDYVEFDQAAYGKVRRAIGSVQFRHEGTYLYCDSAYFHEESNIVEAFSNVHIQDSDTLNLFSDFLEYLPGSGKANAKRNVVLVDPQMSLTTDALMYDLRNKKAYYETGGTIVSKTNTLKSLRGVYHSDEKLFVFEKDVVLTHPKFTLYTDTLHYYTDSEMAHIFGPTLIRSEENLIYAERGNYDTRKDQSVFWRRAWLQNKDTRLSGDSIEYDRNLSYSRAFGNVHIIDTVERYELGGDFGEYDEITGYSFLTDSAWAMVMDSRDTLSLHADTIHVTFDSLRNGKIFSGYYGVKFYRDDVQGACDSMVYHFADSTMVMYTLPVIWFGKTQVIADTILMYFVNEKLDSMEMIGNAFIISDDIGDQYNQVKGKRITCFFEEDELRKMFVYGNTETLYYVRDDEDLLIGIDKARSERLRVEFRDGEVDVLVLLNAPSGVTYPEQELSSADRILKGFLLRKEERPAHRGDIFRGGGGY